MAAPNATLSAGLVMSTPIQKLAIGRGLACKIWPWAKPALLAFVPHECPGLSTVAITESSILLWDAEFIESLTVPQIAWLMLHEVCHLLHSHGARCRNNHYDHELSNVAGDLAINSELQQLNADLPSDGLYPETFGFPPLQTLEQYMELLQRTPKKAKPNPTGNAGHTTGGKKGRKGGAAGQPPPGRTEGQPADDGAGASSAGGTGQGQPP